MLEKLITKSLRSLGLLLIFIFATFSIFGSWIVRDIDSTTILGRLLDYTLSFENRFYDLRSRQYLEQQVDFVSPDIVLVKIDDYSLQKLGVWPIPRTEHAKMLRKLNTFGARVAALDILYPERSPQYGDVSPDTEFARAIEDFQHDGGRVFLAYDTNFTDPNIKNEEALEPPVEMYNDIILTRASETHMIPRAINRFSFPIDEFVETEVGLGTINSTEDSDGIFRRYVLVSNVDTFYFGSLAFNAYEAFVGEKLQLDIFSDGTGEIEVNGKKIEVSRSGETKIRYIGGDQQFPSVSLYDLLDAPDDDKRMQEVLGGKMVFVGSTALGAHDLRPSPINSKMPGVYSHINMAHMLLHQYFYRPSNESVTYSLVFLIGGMLIFVLVQRLGNAFLDALVIGFFLITAYYVDFYYFLPRGNELKLFYCFFGLSAAYSWNTFFKFYEANKEKKQIKGTFARYVAPTIVDEMLKDPEKLQVGGTKMDITCLFSDVRDFTSISEGLSATELSHSLNLYMGAMTDIVFETKGTLDKYIGDAIVAFWGAPLPIGNHAQYAVEGAIKMMEALPAINAEFTRLGRPIFKVGIGLNSGECAVGNMGSSRIFSYTALGDNMNLGARLESLCKHYGAHILISEYTLERLDLAHIKYRPMDKVVVKGKTTPVIIYEVIYNSHPFMQDTAALSTFLSAHEHFQKREFEEARKLFEQLLGAHAEDKACQRFKALCQRYLEQPDLVTDKFDTTVMTEK